MMMVFYSISFNVFPPCVRQLKASKRYDQNKQHLSRFMQNLGISIGVEQYRKEIRDSKVVTENDTTKKGVKCAAI